MDMLLLLKYFKLLVRNFFMYFGCWAMYCLIENAYFASNVNTLRQSLFFGGFMSVAMTVIQFFKDRK